MFSAYWNKLATLVTGQPDLIVGVNPGEGSNKPSISDDPFAMPDSSDDSKKVYTEQEIIDEEKKLKERVAAYLFSSAAFQISKVPETIQNIIRDYKDKKKEFRRYIRELVRYCYDDITFYLSHEMRLKIICTAFYSARNPPYKERCRRTNKQVDLNINYLLLLARPLFLTDKDLVDFNNSYLLRTHDLEDKGNIIIYESILERWNLYSHEYIDLNLIDSFNHLKDQDFERYFIKIKEGKLENLEEVVNIFTKYKLKVIS